MKSQKRKNIFSIYLWLLLVSYWVSHILQIFWRKNFTIRTNIYCGCSIVVDWIFINSWQKSLGKYGIFRISRNPMCRGGKKHVEKSSSLKIIECMRFSWFEIVGNTCFNTENSYGSQTILVYARHCLRCLVRYRSLNSVPCRYAFNCVGLKIGHGHGHRNPGSVFTLAWNSIVPRSQHVRNEFKHCQGWSK